MSFYVTKFSGEREEFNADKLRTSLRNAGADEATIHLVVDAVEQRKPKSTKDVHNLVTNILKQYKPHIADRYNLKRALMELGPVGYPFEQFIGQVFKYQHYTVLTNQIIRGFCVDHEVDVIVEKEGKHCIVECKFHNRPGLKSDVKVVLYTYARFEDIKDAWETIERVKELHEVWMVTNTKFTGEAIKYGMCKKVRLIGWPELATMITQLGLFPITTLIGLNRQQKKMLIQNNIVLCKQILEHPNVVQQLGLPPHKLDQFLAECKAVCTVDEHKNKGPKIVPRSS